MMEAYNPDGVWKPFGPFSQAVVSHRSGLVFVKGQIPLNTDGALVGKDDMEAQTRQVLSNIEAILQALNLAMSDIVSLDVFTTDIDAYSKLSDLRRAYFQEPYPVTTTVEVQRMIDPDILVEIKAVAEK